MLNVTFILIAINFNCSYKYNKETISDWSQSQSKY